MEVISTLNKLKEAMDSVRGSCSSDSLTLCSALKEKVGGSLYYYKPLKSRDLFDGRGFTTVHYYLHKIVDGRHYVLDPVNGYFNYEEVYDEWFRRMNAGIPISSVHVMHSKVG